MKDLTLVVPSYNSEAYLGRCLDSLVIGGDAVEILVINDGSTDRTEEIALSYEGLYPGIVRVISKENGGHGSGVNTGLEFATGRYFKVVDSDDWLQEEAYRKVLAQLREWRTQESSPDLLVCDYTYNHLEEKREKTINYKNLFPEKEVCTWEEIGHFHPSQYLIMHALIYKTECLKKSKVKLPEHTFYVDNIFASYPLTYVESIYYMNEPLYQYYLGREDQSVNEKVLIARIDQQIKVTEIVAFQSDLAEVQKVHPKLATYLCRNISIMMAISSIHLLLAGNAESLEKYQNLWKEIKQKNPELYYRLRLTTVSGLTNLPGTFGKKLTVGGYRIARKIYKFQ